MALDQSILDYYKPQGNNWQDAGYNLSSQYASNPAYLEAYYKLAQQQSGLGSSLRSGLVTRLDDAANQFKNLFKNSVGRDPTNDEIGRYLSESGAQSIISSPNGRSEDNAQAIRNQAAQYIGDTFQQAAQDTATQKTEALGSKYNSLADQYMEMGKKSLGNLSDSLKQYSTSLFEKLRPQLNLAAQAGGYADSGGQTLQEKGALTDLANQGQGVLGNAEYDVENNANNIRYGGMAAPVSMASEFAANTPYAVQNLGAGGVNFNNSDSQAQSQYLRQLGLLSAQGKLMQDQQPSFGRTLSQNFGQSLGQNAGNQFNLKGWYDSLHPM